MQLKRYQREALDRLKHFLELCRTFEPQTAYEKATSDDEAVARLGKARKYEDLGGIPFATLKIPTGGGKTIVGAHALKIAADANGKDAPLVLWLTPSDTIRTQTAEALKNPRHPYHEALEDSFGPGRVRVFDLSEKRQIKPADLERGACIVVATMQAFIHRKREKYNVYADDGDEFEGHFKMLPPGVPEGMDPQEKDPSKPAASFANLCVLHHPVIVADEVHHADTPLAAQTLAALRPCAIVGLSATPQARSNALWSVRASELFDEEMVKLPVELVEFSSGQYTWEDAVHAALAKRDELEKLAIAEWNGGRGEPWLRPIALFQAQSKSNNDDSRITADRLKRFLRETENRPEEEIVVVTGEQKELDGKDVRNPACPVRLVITVEALKEGWDCPSAAVLCSVSNVNAQTSIVQLLGRVMRQPGARRRKTPALNRAFAFVMSNSFGQAAAELAEGLRQRGFDRDEAVAAIHAEPASLPGMDGGLFADSPNAVRLPKEVYDAVAAALPGGVPVRLVADGGANLDIPPALAPGTTEAVAAALERVGGCGKQLAAEWRGKAAAARRRAEEAEAAPVRSRSLALPQLAARPRHDTGVFLWNAEDACAHLCENIAKYVPDELPDGAFRLERQGTAFRLFLDGEAVRATAVQADATPTFRDESFKSRVDAASVVNDLDRLVDFASMPPASKRGKIARIVAGLVAKGATPDVLFAHRHALAGVLLRLFEQARRESKKRAWQQVFRLEGCETAAPELRWDDPFALDSSFAESCVVGVGLRFYDGDWVFNKHFLGRYRIPAFDGQLANGQGEEFDCARLIDHHGAVATWLRNPANHPGAFRLPVSSGWFYPDFVGQLEDGRFFAIEYKGAHIADSGDTLEKTAIGRLWADLSQGRCLYATIVKKDSSGRDVQAQLDALFAKTA